MSKMVPSGKFKSRFWSEVPVDYLFWAVNSGQKRLGYLAKDELNRRGVFVTKEVKVMPSVIDKVSLELHSEWLNARNEDQGIYSWVKHMAVQALNRKGNHSPVSYEGLVFYFEFGEIYPVLKGIKK